MAMSEDFYKLFKASGDNTAQQMEAPKPKTNSLIRKHVNEQWKDDIIKQSSDNIKLSERLRSELNLDIKNDIPLETTLNKALKCISLMTGDEMLYKQYQGKQGRIEELKSTYNKILLRLNDDNPECQKLLTGMNNIIKELKTKGIEVTLTEIEHGFTRNLERMK